MLKQFFFSLPAQKPVTKIPKFGSREIEYLVLYKDTAASFSSHSLLIQINSPQPLSALGCRLYMCECVEGGGAEFVKHGA